MSLWTLLFSDSGLEADSSILLGRVAKETDAACGADVWGCILCSPILLVLMHNFYSLLGCYTAQPRTKRERERERERLDLNLTQEESDIANGFLQYRRRVSL
jgi:hypothetical protein